MQNIHIDSRHVQRRGFLHNRGMCEAVPGPKGNLLCEVAIPSQLAKASTPNQLAKWKWRLQS